MKKILIALLLCAGGITAQASHPVEETEEKPFVTGAFWDNWFVQAGLDMSLQNPYGCNFCDVFPNGKSFGIDVGVGKWFSPQIGLRVRLNWENGIKLFENGHLTWLGKGDHSSNMDGGGYVFMAIDVPLSLTSIFGTYTNDRKWDVFVFPRAGLISNRAISSSSPLLGAGIGCTYQLNERWGLYADMGYHVTTSEFYAGVSGTGMEVSAGSNGFLNFNVGVQFNLGKNGGKKWRRSE